MVITNLNAEQAAVLCFCRAIDHFVDEVCAWLNSYETQMETHKIPPLAAFDHENRIVA